MLLGLATSSPISTTVGTDSCGGAISSPDDINTAMYEMGMYSQNAFAQGKTGLYQGKYRSVVYESTTIAGNELVYAYVE
jgi:hypothetical protein